MEKITMTDIKASSILKLSDSDLNQYKLHLACWNGYEHPLDVYLADWNKWIGWNQSRSGNNDFNRKYIFSLIQFYPNLISGCLVESLKLKSDTIIGKKQKLVTELNFWTYTRK